MCEYEICGCGPVESGPLGPRVATVVDRRVRPSVRIPGDRRGVDEAAAEGRQDSAVQDRQDSAAERPAVRVAVGHRVSRSARAGSLV